MSEDIITSLLQGIVKLALSILGKDKTVSILQVEYDAADLVADAAEKAKFGE